MADIRVEEVEDSEDEEVVQPRNAIESLDHYIERNGIEYVPCGSQSERNLQDERQKLQEESDYQQDIHKSIFGPQDESERDERCSERAQFLAGIRDETIDIETSQQVIRDVPLKSMAESCETLFTLVAFRQSHQSEQEKRLSFSLKSFPHAAVVEFVAIMMGDKRPEEVSADSVVGCCEIASYMQCQHVLESMMNILLQNVNNENAMSLCMLADQLDLPRLFERSLAQMMQSVASLQEQEMWDDFNSELKDRIISLESVMKSSVHCGLHKTAFGSMDEYLSIFAENVQYYRERLAEAKERQLEEPPSGHAWRDAQTKIERQQQRLNTLELVLKDQKELFGNSRRHSSCRSDRAMCR